MERRLYTDMAPFDAAEFELLNPWRFVKEADRARIDVWGGDAFDPHRRASDFASQPERSAQPKGGR